MPLPIQIFNRSRTDTLAYRPTYRTYINTPVNGSPVVDGPYGPIGYEGYTHTTLDCVSPDYHKRIKAGEIVLNDFRSEKLTRTLGKAGLRYKIPEYGNLEQQCIGDLVYEAENEARLSHPLLRFTDVDRAYAINGALIQAYNKLNGPAVMGGEFLSDLDKTIGMMRKPFASAQKLIKDIASAKPKKRMRILKSGQIPKHIADAWLERQFGWIPVCMDLFEIIEQVTQKVTTHRERRVARSGTKNPLKTESWAYGQTIAGGYKADICMQLTFQAAYNAGVIYDIVNRTTSSELMGRFGFRGRDLPSTLWEITPLSWVVDYFVGIGNWLEAVMPNPDVEIQGNWVTEVIKQSKTTGLFNVTCRSPIGTLLQAGNGGSSDIETQLVNRYVHCTLPPLPQLAKTLSPLHSVNLAALSCSKIISQLKALRR